MSSPSLVIRNGTIVDGSGGDPYEADLAVIDGKIAAIGGDIPKESRGDRRARQARHAGLRRRAHALRRAGDLERSALALVLERGHDRPVRQLRRRLRAVPRRPARPADQPDGGRGGHSRSRAERRPAVELAQLPGFPRCALPPGPTMPTSPPRCRMPPCASMSWASAAPTASPPPRRTADAWPSSPSKACAPGRSASRPRARSITAPPTAGASRPCAPRRRS